MPTERITSRQFQASSESQMKGVPLRDTPVHQIKQKRAGKPRKNLESKLQMACYRWLQYQWPKAALLYYKVHNEGKKTKASAGIDKAAGLKRGIPDNCLPIARKGFNSLYIEFKAEGGELSDSQVEMCHRLREEGFRVEVINSTQLFQKVINDYLTI